MKSMNVIIKDMSIPTNCAHCPCLTVTANGVQCGTPTGNDKRICADSLYFDNFRPKWCPLEEMNGNDK